MRAHYRYRALAVIVALAFLVTGCATDKAYREKQARGYRDLGERYLANDQSSQALEQFLKAKEIYPDDPILHYDLALVYVEKRRFDKAESHLKEAIRLKPDYSDAYNYLGVLYYRKGEVDLAIESYKKALDNMLYVNPQFTHLNLGVAYLSRKDYRKAILHLEEAIRLVHNYVDAYNNLGRAYEGLGQYSKAKEYYKKALEFNPRYVNAYMDLGKLSYRLGERRQAKEYFIQVIRLGPNSEKAKEARGYLRKLK